MEIHARATLGRVWDAWEVHVRETFDAETETPPELQRQGWQSVWESFRRHVERNG